MSAQDFTGARHNGGVVMTKHGASSPVTAAARRLSPPLSAPYSSAFLIGALLLLLLLCLTAAATPVDSVYVSTSSALYRALATSQASTVYLTGSIKLNRTDWAVAINISRNVTVAAPPQYQAIGSYITLDFASIVAGIRVVPGSQITFQWLEMVNYVEEVGQAMLLVGASPGGRVMFSHVVQRRLAGLAGKATLAELMQLPRIGDSSPEGDSSTSSSSQTAFFLPRFCFNSSRDGNPHCASDLVYVVDVAARLGPDSSPYFAEGVALGEYDMVVAESVQITDVAIDPDCLLSGAGASVRECVVRQLRLLAIEPVLIKAKPSASNLVKIVASLAILAVAVLLFLYFRRHYRTYQERRARRMRRIKEALGMGREAHGIMFNGLDGEVADWQIMPMPVGYAADEGGTAELHQDSHIRNLIKDMSTRPNRQLPPECGGGGANDVRIEVDGVDANCPIAAEVGLRRTPVLLQVGSAAPAAAAAAEDADSPPGGNCRDRGRGSATGSGTGRASGPGKEESTGEPPPPPPGGKGSGDWAHGVGTAAGGGGGAGGGIIVQRIHPSADSGTTGGAASHRSVTSATSASRTTLTETGGPAGALTAVMLLSGGRGAAGLSSSSGGGGGGGGGRGSQVLEVTGTMSVTKAGMDVLMASRTAAAAAAAATVIASRSGGTGAGSAGPIAAAARLRSSGNGNGSKESQATARPAAGDRQQGPEQRQRQGQGSGDQPLDGAAAAASRHAAADDDVAKDSDADGDDGDGDGDTTKEGEMRPNNGARVNSLMDELEELRRDIMAGINDTQLQIMSVVGSGAFGTVYRGQWQGLEVAVKTVVFSASSENRKRALQEAALCQSINHRNIVATYAVDVQPLGAVNTPVLPLGTSAAAGRNNPNGNPTLSNLLDWRLYIVQEYCDGGPLRKLVQSQYLQTSNGPNMLVICALALELAQALAHLHSKNVIHGDLNPNNVLLKRDASSPIGFRVKMADFGLSVMVPLQKTHMSNLRLGTLYYIAPETCFRGQLGYAADVFSLGVMLWELYHGRLAGTRTPTGEPRYQPDFPDFPAACPPDYRKLAHRCLQKQPHNRLHSSQVVQRLQEMLTTFRAAAAAAPSTAPPPLPPLPLGGPDETALPLTPPPAAEAAAAAGPTFAHHPALTAATATAKPASGTPTPTESRHRPTPPAAGAAAAAAATATAAGGGGATPEISPWQAALESPRASARPNGVRR
ncbi:hypothetical protein PLESTB_001057400 [Pleodorina starrii]|uniref:Protein kinase domain-containing protein n=1 Tax=Pleodorina starrii TaxID=330485 RepID=A0A9W6BPX7_9CHLO|nr:hypothetical protein PLESTB_001057400 [Pleodorina starrii]